MTNPAPFLGDETNVGRTADVPSELDEVARSVVETLGNGVRGHDAAAGEAGDEHLARLFATLRDKRRETLDRFITELPGEVAAELPADAREGTVPGSLHRAWISVESSVGGDASLLESALTGERHAVARLEEAVDEGVPAEAAAAIRHAAADIEAAISLLESEYAARVS